MNRMIRSTLAIVLAVASPQAATEALPESRTQAIDEFVGQFVDFAMFDGSVLVDIGGDTVYDRSFGFAHAEFRVQHNDDTRFHLASVSKALTDAAVAKMIAGGIFTMETPLAEYLPDFPFADVITIGHLVSHTSGVPHTNRQPWGDGSLSLAIGDIVERLSELPLDYEPGSGEAYSNGGYAVLARILEIAGNGTFSEVMHATVLDPLGMTDTDHVTDIRTLIPNKATGYEPGLHPGERRHARFYAIESKPGGGSMYSTKGDMLKFMRGIFRNDFVSADLRRSVMGVEDDGYLAQGRSPGFVAKVLYQRQGDVIVISLSNSYAVPSDWALAIANLATGKVSGNPWPELIPATEPVAADDPRIGRFQSSYSDEPTLVSLSRSGSLMIGDANSAQNALIPLAGGNFLQPLYFQMCVQDNETRVFICTMLSGEEAYTSTHTPITD